MKYVLIFILSNSLSFGSPNGSFGTVEFNDMENCVAAKGKIEKLAEESKIDHILIECFKK